MLQRWTDVGLSTAWGLSAPHNTDTPHTVSAGHGHGHGEAAFAEYEITPFLGISAHL